MVYPPLTILPYPIFSVAAAWIYILKVHLVAATVSWSEAGTGGQGCHYDIRAYKS